MPQNESLCYQSARHPNQRQLNLFSLVSPIHSRPISVHISRHLEVGIDNAPILMHRNSTSESDAVETRGFEPPNPFRGLTSLAVRRTRPGYATSSYIRCCDNTVNIEFCFCLVLFSKFTICNRVVIR